MTPGAAGAVNRVVVNGKFLAQPLTGVQRAAGELLAALDAALAAAPGGPVQAWQVALPPGAAAPAWRCLQPRPVAAPLGLGSLHAWEQWALPAAARGALLLNLSGSAPWRRPGDSVAMLHDAAVFEHPQAYTTAFVQWYRLLFRHLGRRARALLTPSRFSAQRLALHLGVPEARLWLQPLGADHLDRHRGGDAAVDARGVWPLAELLPALPPGTPFLLAVGSRNPTKNLARVEQAFVQAAAARPSLQLVLVGEARATVFRGDAGVAAHPRIHRLGRVDDRQLQALYRHGRALVFPSLTEGFGLPPLEAMHAGCPVIASACGALAEVCGDAALTVDPLSVPEIAAAMARLADDAAEAARLRAAGHVQAARWRWAEAGRTLRAHVERSVVLEPPR